jgi:hypothetical protein
VLRRAQGGCQAERRRGAWHQRRGRAELRREVVPRGVAVVVHQEMQRRLLERGRLIAVIVRERRRSKGSEEATYYETD